MRKQINNKSIDNSHYNKNKDKFIKLNKKSKIKNDINILSTQEKVNNKKKNIKIKGKKDKKDKDKKM